MEQRLETFSAPIVIQDIEDTSNKKSKKKKKKHDKEGGEHHKHKKSKHKKEKRNSDGNKNDESSVAPAGLTAPASFQPGMPIMDGSTIVSQYNSHPPHQWPPSSVAPPSISTYEGSPNQMISNPCTPLVSPGSANVQRSSMANPIVLNTQTSVSSVNTPPLSPGNFLHLRHMNPDAGSHNGNSAPYQGTDRFSQPNPSRFPPAQPMERMELPPTVRGMPPPPGAFLAAANSRFPLGPPPGIGNLPLIPPERFLTPPPSMDGSVPNPPLNPAMYQRPPPAGFSQPPPQQPGNTFQGNGSFQHGMPPPGSGGFPARPPMPIDFLPLHEFPPPKPGGAGNPAAYQQHPDQQNRMVIDYQTSPHIINNTLALPQKIDPNGTQTDLNHNQNNGGMPLGSADYTKIVQALETLKSSNVIASTPPPTEKVEHELETEPVSPPREDKKSKKHKRHKKERKKESKKKLEEKLADVANMNDEERNALLEEINNKEKDKKESKKEKIREKEQRTKDPEWDWSKEGKEEKEEESKGAEGQPSVQVVSDDASGSEKVPAPEVGPTEETDKTAALTVDTSTPPVSSANSSQPALSIQFNPKSSKFNLKIGSPVMKGNIFQKYKARTEAPSFNKHADQADRKYRKNTGKEGDAVPIDDDDDEDDDDENDPKTKEQLLKMLGIEAPAPVVKKEEEEMPESAPPGVDADDDKEIYSGSEEGEVVSDEEEMEERKRLKEIIKQAKVEALKSATNSPPSRNDDTLSPADAAMEESATNEKKDKSGVIDGANEGVKDISDGELSTDGEVSSDGELSDDSLDEFGRSKKLRGSMPINSPSDSSESEDGGARWDPSANKSPSRTDGHASDRSRSHSPRSVRSVSPDAPTEKSAEVPVQVATDDNKDVVSDPAPVAEENVDKEKENVEKDKLKVEEEKAAIEKERLRLEVEQREAAEKERLRLEVEKLESTIDEEAVSKIKHIPNDGSESSATDISDEEDVPASEGIVITPSGPQSAVQSARQSRSGSPVHENSAAENLRREMMEMINKKEKEKEVIEANGVVPVVEEKANVDALDKDGNDEKKKEKEDSEEQKGDDYIDIFADSDNELNKENSDLEAEMEQDKSAGTEEKMETDKVDTQGGAVEKTAEEPSIEEVSMDVQDNADVASGDKVSPSTEGVEKTEEESKKEDQEDYEDTLKSLSEIRNNMSSMSKEELEEALAKLPSLTHETVCEDGRVTPPHLRDMVVPVQSLTEYVEDKKALYKQVFKNINKKEFKFMLPKYLRKFDVKTVRNWCLDEMEIMSKKRLRAIILRQFLASSSSESEDEEEEEEKPVQVKKELKKATKEKKDKDEAPKEEEEKPKKKSKKDIKKEKKKDKKGKKDKSKKKKAKEEKEGNKDEAAAVPSIVKVERVEVSDEAAEDGAMDVDKTEKVACEEADKIPEDKGGEDDGGAEKAQVEFLVKVKQEKVEKSAEERVKVKEEKGRRAGKGGKNKSEDLTASEIIRIKKEVQSAEEEEEGGNEAEEVEKPAEPPIMKIKQEKMDSNTKKSESPAAATATESKKQKGYGHVPVGLVKIKTEPSDNGAFDKAAGLKVEPGTGDGKGTPDKKETVPPPEIEVPKDPIKIKQEKQEKEFVADFTVIDETKCTSTKKSESEKSKKDTSQDDSSSDSDSDDSKDSKSDSDGSDSNENKSDSVENKSDSDNKSKSGESGDNKSGSDSDSDSGSDSSESENKSSSDSDADDVNISSDDVRRAMQSTSDDDDDDDEEAKEDSSANDSDDESSDTESKPRKTKAKRKEGQVEVKREPKSSSGSDNSSSDGEEESSAKEKTKKETKHKDLIEMKAKEEIRRRRSDLAGERDQTAPESYRNDKEKQRAEKEKLLRQQKDEDSDPDSEADYEEEVNERRHRLARYYREKERLKQEKQQPGEASQRKVVRVKRGGSSNEERAAGDHETSDDSNQDERGRFKSEMNEVSMSIERNNQEHEQFMKYMSLKRKRDQEKTDLRRKLEGNKGGSNSSNPDSETLIIRKNQFANRRQVHVNEQAPGQGGGPPVRPQPPAQPGQHPSPNPPNANQREKPEGYDERRRQREMEKRKMEAAASGGGGARGRDSRGRDSDHRAGGVKDNYGDKNYNEKDNYPNERTNYPERGNYDKSDNPDRGNYNEKGNYQNKGNYQGGNYNDTTYNPRGRQRTRSVQGHDQGGAHDKKPSEDYSRESSANRKPQRATSREQRDTSREQRDTSRDKPARDLPKRKGGHSSSDDESGNKSGRKRKRRGGAAGGAAGNAEGGAGASGGGGGGSGGAAGAADAKPASHLRELEFRARALQSLLNKKEETNKQTARRRGR